MRDRAKVCRVLLNHMDVDAVNLKNAKSTTALHHAASTGSASMVQILVESRKVDCSLKTCDNNLPIDLARKQRGKSGTEIVKILQQAMMGQDPAWAATCSWGYSVPPWVWGQSWASI